VRPEHNPRASDRGRSPDVLSLRGNCAAWTKRLRITATGLVVILDIHPGDAVCNALGQGKTLRLQTSAIWQPSATHYAAPIRDKCTSSAHRHHMEDSYRWAGLGRYPGGPRSARGPRSTPRCSNDDHRRWMAAWWSAGVGADYATTTSSTAFMITTRWRFTHRELRGQHHS